MPITLTPVALLSRLFADMDAWGYHFIPGSAQAWLRRAGLIDRQDNPQSHLS